MFGSSEFPVSGNYTCAECPNNKCLESPVIREILHGLTLSSGALRQKDLHVKLRACNWNTLFVNLFSKWQMACLFRFFVFVLIKMFVDTGLNTPLQVGRGRLSQECDVMWDDY